MRLCLGSSDPSKSTGMLYLPPHYKPLGSYIETVANEEQKNVGWVESSSDFGIVPRFGDFSSGEGGFELFDHQHRYNGQDGMISLGGGPSASTSPSSATSQTNPSADEVVPHSHIRVPTLPTSTKMASDPSAMLSYYNSLSSCISARIDSVLLDLSFYYARRIILLVLCAPPPSLQPLTLSSLSAPGVTPSRAASDLLAVVSSVQARHAQSSDRAHMELTTQEPRRVFVGDFSVEVDVRHLGGCQEDFKSSGLLIVMENGDAGACAEGRHWTRHDVSGHEDDLFVQRKFCGFVVDVIHHMPPAVICAVFKMGAVV